MDVNEAVVIRVNRVEHLTNFLLLGQRTLVVLYQQQELTEVNLAITLVIETPALDTVSH